MNGHTALKSSAAEQMTLAPDDQGDSDFLNAIQDPEARKQVIAILKHAGLIHG